MSEEYYREILKSPIMVGGFEGIRVFSVNCANSTEQHISLPVGKNNIIGCKIMFRDSKIIALLRVYLATVKDIYQEVLIQKLAIFK